MQSEIFRSWPPVGGRNGSASRRGAVSAWVLLVVMALGAVGLLFVQEGAKDAARARMQGAIDKQRAADIAESQRAYAAQLARLSEPRFQPRTVEFRWVEDPFPEDPWKLRWYATTGPRGTFIVEYWFYGEDREGRYVSGSGIARIDPARDELEMLIDTSVERAHFLSASLNAERLAWSAVSVDPPVRAARVLDLRTGLLRTVGSPRFQSGLFASSISPDGTMLAGRLVPDDRSSASNERPTRRTRLAVVDIETGAERVFDWPERISGYFSWVPGTSHLIVTGGSEIAESSPPSQTDSSRAMSQSEHERVWRVPLDGSEPTVLSKEVAHLTAPLGVGNRGNHASADGKYLLVKLPSAAQYEPRPVALLDTGTGETTVLETEGTYFGRAGWHPTEPMFFYFTDSYDDPENETGYHEEHYVFDLRTMESTRVLRFDQETSEEIGGLMLWRVGDEVPYFQNQRGIYRIVDGGLEPVWLLPERLVDN